MWATPCRGCCPSKALLLCLLLCLRRIWNLGHLLRMLSLLRSSRCRNRHEDKLRGRTAMLDLLCLLSCRCQLLRVHEGVAAARELHHDRRWRHLPSLLRCCRIGWRCWGLRLLL